MLNINPWILVIAISVSSLVLLLRLKYGFFAFLAFAPFNYYYGYLAWNVLTTGTIMQKSFKDIFILIIYFFWLLFILVNKQTKFPRFQSTSLILLFSFVVIMHTLRSFSLAAYPAMIGLRNMIEFVPLVFLVPSLIKNKHDVEKAIWLSFVCCLVVALLGFNETYRIVDRSGLLILGNYRVHSTLFNPNLLGVYLSTFSLLVLAMYFSGVYFIGKRFSLFMFYVFSSCLFLTFSKTATLAFICALLYLFLLKKRFLYFLSVCLLLAFVYAILFVAFPKNRFVETVDTENSNSITSRYENIISAYELLERKPQILFVGAGFDQVSGILQIDPQASQLKGATEISSDNFYLALLMGGGMFSFLIFLFMMILIFKDAREMSLLVKDPFLKALASGIGPIIIAYLVSGVGGETWMLFPLNFYFWFFVGLLLAIKEINNKKRLALA